MSSAPPLLEIVGYSLTLRASDGRVRPVLEDVSLTVSAGECVGIAGESGSGKSVLAQSLMGLFSPESVVDQMGVIQFAGLSLLDLAEPAWRTLRGARMAMVFQEPMTALNPTMTLWQQMAEIVVTHRPGSSRQEVEATVRRALTRSGLPEPARLYDAYPHQLSGGMRQRAMLAMALVMEPDLILADEPTTALDAGLQVQLLRELRTLVETGRRALIFISHDLGALRAVADRLVILYAGIPVEMGKTPAVLATPAHPYTAALIKALPRLHARASLPHPIPGHLPPPESKPAGCVFVDRCDRRQEICAARRPPPTPLGATGLVRCHFPLRSGEPAPEASI
jgi:peptide/nickel transport system ATP-binding protein